MKRKLQNIFENDSQDQEDSHCSRPPPSSCQIDWKLESCDPTVQAVALLFNGSGICRLGRADLNNSKFISTNHCEIFKNSNGELLLSSLARYDVIYVDNILAMKDTPILLKENCEIRFCKAHFKYNLRKKVEQAEKKEIIKEEIGAFSLREMNEGVQMALEDLDGLLRVRYLRDFELSISLSRKLLSSFYCDICLNVIAACRSCVPCGHNFCGTCITEYIAVSKNGPAKCPKCRENIRETIPNKSIDAAVSDSLTNTKSASDACRTHVNSNLTPEISESQDITLWSTRYDENEASIKSKASKSATPTVPRVPIHTIYENDDDDDDDDEDDSRYDGSNAHIEYARSARSRCIVCQGAIINRELRMVVTESYDYHDGTERFVHLRCVASFNEMVSSRHRIVASRINLRHLSPRDSQTVRDTIGY